MIKLGLTGGIGSGKTTVAKIFQELSVPVYFADIEAKKFLFLEEVKLSLKSLFGSSVLNDSNEIDKAILASIVFTDANELAKLNALIHPLLEIDFEKWASEQHASYIVKEAAILFEAGFDTSVDKIITVSAPENQRIVRVMARDHVSKQQVMDRITKQWTDKQREEKSDYIIKNADEDMILNQILEIHTNFIS
ncbi:MAG: dephospho-CoA kinase [Bacteroidales bacterium]|nr:dephospho-CoA kinase [Bacteroidales bacterium]